MRQLAVTAGMVWLAAAVLNISAQEPAQKAKQPHGQEAFTAAYSLYMAGDLPAARAAFDKTAALQGCHPDYAANALLMAGILDAVMNRPDQARATFLRVRGMTNAAPTYALDAECSLAKLAFEAGDLAGASNLVETARAGLSKLTWTSDYDQVKRILNLYADYIRQGRWGLRGARDRIGSQIEMQARLAVLREQLAAQGMTPARRYLQGVPISGPWERYPAYPAPGFRYRWDFDDNTLCGIDRTNGLADVSVQDGCLAAMTQKDAMFGWGRMKSVDQQPALQFGYGSGFNEQCPDLRGFKVRLRQSLPESDWQAQVTGFQRGRMTLAESRLLKVKGSDWQEIFIPLAAPKPPYAGVQILSGTAGNKVEIDWVRPCIYNGILALRKELTLPAPVCWAKVSLACANFSGADGFKLFVNGREAAKSPPTVLDNQIWNFDLDRKLFVAGRNVLALESGLRALVDGALLCEDGTYVRFDSDASWRAGAPAPGDDWTAPDYDDRAWAAAQLEQSGQTHFFWFNPSWKGRIMAQPADGRSQPIFGSREEVALRVAVPSAADNPPAVTWTLYDEMGDSANAADRKICSGSVNLKSQISNLKFAGQAGEIKFPAGKLPANHAYALELVLQADGREVEKYRYEFAVCGPVTLPELAAPTNYTDGMELKLVWETDAAAEQAPGAFVSCDGWARLRPAPVIETPLGRFRQTFTGENLGSMGGEPCNYISFVYRLQNPGRPHVALAEYPDDTVRCQEMRVSEGGFTYANEIGNDTVMLGLDHPLTHAIREQHCLFFPGRKIGTVSFFALGGMSGSWRPDKAARVGKIRIYEVLNEVPARIMADAPGPRKWIGQLPEAGPREIFQSCFSSPAAEYIRHYLIAGEQPNFYRNWLATLVNMVKRMKFAGENAYFCGQFMYNKVLYPSLFSDETAFGMSLSGSLRDYGVLLAKTFEENNLGFFSAIQMGGANRIGFSGDDEAVAAGNPTLVQVDRAGSQPVYLGGKSGFPNWLLPEGRFYYQTVINELIALYGQEPGWKGIVIHLYAGYGNGQLWVTAPDDPYFASYDDYTIALFEKETRVKIPVEANDPARFSKRADWLLANAKAEWTDWRCEKFLAIHRWTRDRLKATRPELELIMYPYDPFIIPAWDEKPEDALPSIFDYGRRGGLDLEKIKDDPGMILAMNVTARTDYDAWFAGRDMLVGRGRFLAQRDRSLTPFANDGKNGVAVRYNWYEAQPLGPVGWLWAYSATEAWPYPQDDYFADYWINAFVRTHPRLILHPLMDVIVWNGRETSMSKFAQAFRSLPAIPYVRLAGNGRDQNLWIGAGVYSNQTYAYVANTYWWDADVQIELAGGVKGRELTAGTEVTGGRWAGRLLPFSMRTFRFDGAQDEPIAGAQARVSDAGVGETRRRLAELEANVAACRPLLENANRAGGFDAIIRDVKTACDAGAFGAAYDKLTCYPSRLAFLLIAPAEYSEFLTDGWRISRLIPRADQTLAKLEPIRGDAPAMDWKPVGATGNRIIAHDVYGDRDGFVAFANRLHVPVGGPLTLCLGHDGGCRVFVDGQQVVCEPRRRNPIREDRTKAALELTAGVHDLTVILDTDHGMGYGFVLRFQAPEDALRKGIEYPFAME